MNTDNKALAERLSQPMTRSQFPGANEMIEALLAEREQVAAALTREPSTPSAQAGEPDGYTAYGEFRWACDCDDRMKREWTPVYTTPQPQGDASARCDGTGAA